MPAHDEAAALKQLSFPLGDLGWVDFVGAGQPRRRLLLFDGRKCNLKLEGGTPALSFLGHLFLHVLVQHGSRSLHHTWSSFQAQL